MYGTAVLGGGLGVGAVVVRGELSLWAVVLVGLVAFDLFGGAAANATAAAKRTFHAPGRAARHRLGFVAAHGQPFLLALVVPGLGWAAAAVIYALALAGAVAVTAAPGAVRRPVAFAVTVLAIGVTTVTVSVPDELAWLAPVLFVKLLLGHLLPEESRG
ncbi:hypothetical protein ABZ626_09785 [Streptomyces longispororuber]|uniref:hypothetical protein n=1 Tax=Streptomyces longispororuber TaxID=68230 RepID=UPI0033EE56DC